MLSRTQYYLVMVVVVYLTKQQLLVGASGLPSAGDLVVLPLEEKPKHPQVSLMIHFGLARYSRGCPLPEGPVKTKQTICLLSPIEFYTNIFVSYLNIPLSLEFYSPVRRWLKTKTFQNPMHCFVPKNSLPGVKSKKKAKAP